MYIKQATSAHELSFLHTQYNFVTEEVVHNNGNAVWNRGRGRGRGRMKRKTRIRRKVV